LFCDCFVFGRFFCHSRTFISHHSFHFHLSATFPAEERPHSGSLIGRAALNGRSRAKSGSLLFDLKWARRALMLSMIRGDWRSVDPALRDSEWLGNWASGRCADSSLINLSLLSCFWRDFLFLDRWAWRACVPWK